MRVILADDHAILRRGLTILLEARPEVTVVAEASDGREAIDLTERLRPDVVIMDVAMPRFNGIQATREIRARFPQTKVVILSAHGDPDSLGHAMVAGASAFLIKRSDIDELVLALTLVATGNTYFSRELAEHMDVSEIVHAARSRESTDSDLTAREREVLQLIAEGHTMKSIAGLLCISPKTVEGHNGRIMAKAGAKNRADLVRYAIGAGLVRFDDVPKHGSLGPTSSEGAAQATAPYQRGHNEHHRAS